MDTTDDALFRIEPASTRICGRCKVAQPLAMFYIAAEARATAKRGVSVKRPCRYCQQEINRQKMAPKRDFVDSLKSESGCMRCGHRDPGHPEVFDFDHLPGTVKSAEITQLYTRGTFDDLLAEIAKCEILCGNCHRIRTHKERSYSSFGRDRGPEQGAVRNPTGRNGRNSDPRKQADRDIR